MVWLDFLKGFPFENRTMASLSRTVPEPFPTNSLPLPPGSRAGFTQRTRSASLMDGIDGMGWDGVSSVLQCALYFVGIKIMSCIYLLTYIIINY